MFAKTTQQFSRLLVGGYEVVERLATTDLGAVFKARHPDTGHLVAVKMAGRATARDPVLRERFEQEFTVTRGLDHPHLVRALAFGCEGELPYIVMEFVDGPSLGDRIEREGRLPEAEALRIITEVADALHYAHQRRVIHRDVKPDNILLLAGGTAKLTDLGLAKDFDSDRGLTRDDTGLGTPNFMAPEQFSDAKNATPLYDVYSLGATLYMALTGVLPFHAPSTENIWEKKLRNDLVPPRRLVPSLSPHVEAAVCRAVHVNPQERPGSCLQFIQELTGAAGVPAPADPGPARAERRATVRYSSSKLSSCRPLGGAKGMRWTAKVKDVSAGGIALVLGRRFEPSTILSVKLAATDQDPDRRLLVRVVRVMPLSADTWLLGCAFPQPLSDDEVQSLL